jgi:hypothetical protein
MAHEMKLSDSRKQYEHELIMDLKREREARKLVDAALPRQAEIEMLKNRIHELEKELDAAQPAGTQELRELIAKLADSLKWYMRMASEAELPQFGVFSQAKDALQQANEVLTPAPQSQQGQGEGR